MADDDSAADEDDMASTAESASKTGSGSATGSGVKRGRPPSKRTRVETSLLKYHGNLGLQIGKLNQADGQAIVIGGAEATAAWMDAYDSDPRARKVLEAVTIGGPWMLQVGIAYGGIALAICANHGINPLEPVMKAIASLFQRHPKEDEQYAPYVAGSVVNAGPAGNSGPSMDNRANNASTQPDNASGPVEPHGPVTVEGFGAIPDEGLPWELEKQVREISRKLNRPYQEVRAEAIAALAQLQMQSAPPGALGNPVAKG